MVRVALKLAYDGTRFRGNQVQPEARTVHAELTRGLRALGLPEAPVHWAGRTDAGVSAAGNVAVVTLPRAEPELARRLSFQMEDAWAWAQAEVPASFQPRHALRRHYRYHLATELDAPRIEDALRVFLGTHDWRGIARVPPEANPVRTVERVAARRSGALVVVDVEGPSFVYNQVRRMVEAARRVAAGELDAREVEAALAGKVSDLGIAPPEPLVLMDVVYRDVRFEALAPQARSSVFRRLAEAREALRVRAAVMGAMLDGVEAP